MESKLKIHNVDLNYLRKSQLRNYSKYFIYNDGLSISNYLCWVIFSMLKLEKYQFNGKMLMVQNWMWLRHLLTCSEMFWWFECCIYCGCGRQEIVWLYNDAKVAIMAKILFLLNIFVNLLIIKNACIQNSQECLQVLRGHRTCCWAFIPQDGWRLF